MRFLAIGLAAMTGLLVIHAGALADDLQRDAVKRRKSAPSKFATAAPLSQERWSIAWSPDTELRLPAVAAYSAEGLPQVLYNPRLLAGHPRPIAKFLAMRQEVVLMMSESTGKRSVTAVASTRLPEESVYPLVARYGAFGNVSALPFAPHVIDCFALLFLTSDERQTVAFYASENSRFFTDAFDPPHDLLERGRALTDCPAMDPGYDGNRGRQRFLKDWGAASSR